MSDAHHDLFSSLHASLRRLADAGILEEDDPLLTESFVEGETDFPDFLDKALLAIEKDEIMVKGLTAHIKELNDRKRRIKQRIDNLRGVIELALMKFDVPRIETTLATVSLKRVPPALGDIDESVLPSKYFKQPDPVIDRKALLVALKAGEPVPGVSLTNGGQTLQIRR